MNQLATTEKQERPSKPLGTGAAISAFIPQDSTQLLRLADVLSRSGDMIPKAFQNNAPAITTAIMRGMEIGLAPLQALSSIAVINGRATLWGDAMPALMQRAGHHIDVELTGDGDNLTAVATLTRGDTGKSIVRRFSAADAKRAGLIGKPGPWQNYTGRMLSMRARAWAIRDGAADALMGLQIADDAEGPDRARDVTPAAPRRGGVIYRDDDAALPPPAVDEVLDADPIAALTPDEIEARMAQTAAEFMGRDPE